MKIISIILLSILNISILSASDWTLKWNSPAINSGVDLANAGVTKDIIGFDRPTGDSAVDMGAFELPFYSTTITYNNKGIVSNFTNGAVILNPKGRNDLIYIIVPNSGCNISSVFYNNVNVTADLVNNIYSAPELIGNSTLSVQFIETTGIEDNMEDKFRCYSVDKRIEVVGLLTGENILIYNITGKLVSTLKVSNSIVSATLPAGVYFVKVVNKTNKVIVF